MKLPAFCRSCHSCAETIRGIVQNRSRRAFFSIHSGRVYKRSDIVLVLGIEQFLPLVPRHPVHGTLRGFDEREVSARQRGRWRLHEVVLGERDCRRADQFADRGGMPQGTCSIGLHSETVYGMDPNPSIEVRRNRSNL